MLIFNGIDILKKYENVRLLSVEDTGEGQINNNFVWIHGITPVENLNYQNSNLKISLLVEENEILISKLIKELSNGELIFNEIYSNLVTIVNFNKEFIQKDVYRVDIEYSASFKMTQEQEININSFTSLEYEGDLNASIDVIIQSSNLNCDFILNGNTISITGVKHGDIIEILKNGKVLINNTNGFDRVNFHEFPKLLIGTNEIDVLNCTAIIKYRNLYL